MMYEVKLISGYNKMIFTFSEIRKASEFIDLAFDRHLPSDTEPHELVVEVKFKPDDSVDSTEEF